MQRWTFCLLSLVLSFSLIGCGGQQASTAEECLLDAENLSGDWVSITGVGTGADKVDMFSRVRFEEKDGKKRAIYTAGKVSPDLPVTNKYTYEFVEKTNLGDVMYSKNMFPDKSPQRIARLRKDNRRLDVKFEGRIYVKVDKRQCALVLSDMYVTYVKNEEMMDSNPSGTRTYISVDRIEGETPEMSFVHCDEVNQLLPFAEEKLDWDKEPQPLDPKKDIFVGEPVYLHYIEKSFEGDKDEVKEKLTEAGIYGKEGATYDYEIWMRDIRVPEAQKVAVVADTEDDDRIPWVYQHTFKKAPEKGIFVEMHRYQTVGGERTLIGNACKVVWPEPERTEEEKEEEPKEDSK